MKKKFESAEVRVIKFEAMDIMTASDPFADPAFTAALDACAKILTYDTVGKTVQGTEVTKAIVDAVISASTELNQGNSAAAHLKQITAIAGCVTK